MPIFFHVDIKNIQCESGKFKIGKPCVPGGSPLGRGCAEGAVPEYQDSHVSVALIKSLQNPSALQKISVTLSLAILSYPKQGCFGRIGFF